MQSYLHSLSAVWPNMSMLAYMQVNPFVEMDKNSDHRVLHGKHAIQQHHHDIRPGIDRADCVRANARHVIGP